MPEPLYEDLHCHPVTHRQRRDQQLSMLRGIVEGIAADQTLVDSERNYLDRWRDEHAGQALEMGFQPLIAHLHAALEDNTITASEKTELLDRIEMERSDRFYDLLTSRMQEFHGMLAGIAADGVVNEAEVQELRSWMEANEDLADRWPFTETHSLIAGILTAEGKVNPAQHSAMLAWSASFGDLGPPKRVPFEQPGQAARGLLAVGVEIVIRHHSFCLTGASHRASRRTIHGHLERLDGFVYDQPTRDLDYLIYCDGGQKAWAYTCYGRKVEQVMEGRRERRCTTLIVAEADLWDALAEHGIEPVRREASPRMASGGTKRRQV